MNFQTHAMLWRMWFVKQARTGQPSKSDIAISKCALKAMRGSKPNYDKLTHYLQCNGMLDYGN